MSFSDVGKGPKRGPSQQSPKLLPATIPESSSLSLNDGLSQISDGILQYQRNLGILERIAGQVGSKSDGPVLEQQYKVQVDVLKQLGDKLNQQLQQQESLLGDLPRSEVAKKRATHVKLARDFRRVEATFKNVQLETRRKRARIHQHYLQTTQQQASSNTSASTSEGGDGALQQQLQQEDRLHEEIMREREEEIRGIHRGMHQVNEIYKDLAHIVGSQQEDVDNIETQMQDSKQNAEMGLAHVTKANEKASASQCTIS